MWKAAWNCAIRTLDTKSLRSNSTRYSAPTGQSSFGRNTSTRSPSHPHLPATAGVTVMPRVTSLSTAASGATGRLNAMRTGLGFASFASISVRAGEATENVTATGLGCAWYQRQPA